MVIKIENKKAKQEKLRQKKQDKINKLVLKIAKQFNIEVE